MPRTAKWPGGRGAEPQPDGAGQAKREWVRADQARCRCRRQSSSGCGVGGASATAASAACAPDIAARVPATPLGLPTHAGRHLHACLSIMACVAVLAPRLLRSCRLWATHACAAGSREPQQQQRRPAAQASSGCRWQGSAGPAAIPTSQQRPPSIPRLRTAGLRRCPPPPASCPVMPPGPQPTHTPVSSVLCRIRRSSEVYQAPKSTCVVREGRGGSVEGGGRD